jgi:hypothetical protein
MPLRKLLSDRRSVPRPAAPPPARPAGPTFTRDEKRRIFKGMVVGELEAGYLRYSRRQALLRYAAKLGISEFDATLLIAEAQFHSGEIEPVHFDTAATLDSLTRPDNWSISLRLVFAVVAAVCIDVAVIYWLLA